MFPKPIARKNPSDNVSGIDIVKKGNTILIYNVYQSSTDVTNRSRYDLPIPVECIDEFIEALQS